MSLQFVNTIRLLLIGQRDVLYVTSTPVFVCISQLHSHVTSQIFIPPRHVSEQSCRDKRNTYFMRNKIFL